MHQNHTDFTNTIEKLIEEADDEEKIALQKILQQNNEDAGDKGWTIFPTLWSQTVDAQLQENMLAIWANLVNRFKEPTPYNVLAEMAETVELMCPAYMETYRLSDEAMDWKEKQMKDLRKGPYVFPEHVRKTRQSILDNFPNTR